MTMNNMMILEELGYFIEGTVHQVRDTSKNSDDDDDDDDKDAMHIKKTHNNQPKCGAHRLNNVEWC